MSSEPKLKQLTAAEAAKLFAVDVRTMTRWIADGLPARRSGRAQAIDPVAAVAWVRARDAEAAEERLEAALARVDPDSALGRKRMAEARIKELDLAEREGQLVQADQVEDTWLLQVVALREAVMDAPAVAVQSGLIDTDKELALEEILRDALAAASKNLKAVAEDLKARAEAGE